MTVTLQELINGFKQIIFDGDTIVVHSSLKSIGQVEGGAETVIAALIKSVGESGTVVMPALCQNDWENVYKNWNRDKSLSDVGLITETFRKTKGVLRSNQATHSVCAIGKNAEYLTFEHGERGKRLGIFGDTPFAKSSPWEKLYAMNAKIVFLGVTMLANTIKHLLEYKMMENAIKSIDDEKKKKQLIAKVWTYSNFKERGVWPLLDAVKQQELMENEGLLTKCFCGNAQTLCVESKKCLDATEKAIRDNPKYWLNEITFEWFKEIGFFSLN